MTEITAAPTVAPADKSPDRTARDTRQRLLDAAITEFCAQGRRGASTARIVEGAECNIRMLYHYFGNKEGLYRAALLHVYDELRAAEHRQDFWSGPPTEGILKLVHFTFDYMNENRQFPKMILAENLMGGITVAETREPYQGSRALIENLDALIARGHDTGEFSKKPAALDLYLTILALSFIHISNQHTLGATFGTRLDCAEFIEERRRHVVEVVFCYLRQVPDDATGETSG